MRFRRSRRPDGPAVERLLDPTVTGPADDPVARLLAAAAAPARPGELAGEEAALAAFRAARTQRPVPTASRPRRTARAVAWLAGLAVVATAGVAVATVGRDRSDPPPPPAPTVSSPGPGSPGDSDPPAPGTIPTPSTSGATPGATPRRPAGPHIPGPEAQHGLCHAYLAKPAGQRGRALESPAFQALVEAAGGADQVDAYCRALVGLEPDDRPSSAGGPTTQRTGPPADQPSPSR